MRPLRSLRLRLLLAGLASVALALAAAMLGLGLLFGRHAERQLARELDAVTEGIAAQLDRAGDGAWRLAAPPGDPRHERPLSGFYWQVSRPDGTPVLVSRSLWDADLPLPPLTGAGRLAQLAGPGGQALLALRRDVTMPARLGGETLAVVAARDAAEVAEAMAGFRRDLLPFLALIGAVLLAASAAQLAVGLAPLGAVRRRLGAIRSGRATRLGQGFPSEVLPLAREVDALLEQRERDVAAARARAADLAHGLKTPVQVLIGEAGRLAEAGQAGAAGAVGEAAEAMRRHVERELARARRAARGTAGERAEPSRVARRIIGVLARTDAGARLDWRVEGPPGAAVALHEDDLAEALGAVLENAARFAAGRVTVAIREEARQVVIAVVDDGPGLPEVGHAEALRRGGRLDEGGSGLGLAIAREVAEGAGGTLRLGPTGAGAMTVSLRLPAAPAAPPGGG